VLRRRKPYGESQKKAEMAKKASLKALPETMKCLKRKKENVSEEEKKLIENLSSM